MKVEEVINKLEGYENYDFIIKKEDIYTTSTTTNKLEDFLLSVGWVDDEFFDDYLKNDEISNYNIEIDEDKEIVYLIIYNEYCDVYNEDDPADAWFFED